MGYRYRTIEHTADIGLEAWGDSLEELMQGLGEALAGLVCPSIQVRPAQRTELSVEAEDPEALAVDFLSLLLRRMQAGRFLVNRVQVRQVGPLALEAQLEGEAYDPNRHELGEEIKAVTYHQVLVEPDGSQWHGRVYLDL